MRRSSSKPAQDLLAAVEEDRLDTEALKNAGELNGDISAADDADALRQAIEMECLIGGDGEFVPGQMAGNEWRRSGGDEDVFRR